MNRTKILEKFSSKFKTRKFSDQQFDENDRKMKKERLRSARRAKMEEEDVTWDERCQVTRDRD